MKNAIVLFAKNNNNAAKKSAENIRVTRAKDACAEGIYGRVSSWIWILIVMTIGNRTLHSLTH